MVAALAACGGGSAKKPVAAQTIRGAGFVFRAPGDWHVKRHGNAVSASPKPVSPELVSVTVFPLSRAYTPSLYRLEVTKELDPYARQLAAQQRGKLIAGTDLTVAGIKSRQYELRYTHAGAELGERITFVFRGKTEYELLCQWDASKPEPAPCSQLTSTFRPV